MCWSQPKGITQAASTDAGWLNTAISEAQSEFGDATTVFKDLYNAFAPIVKAGINQFGFSAAEDAALRSQIVQGGAQSQAAALRASRSTAGNFAAPSGAVAGREAAAAEVAAANTSSQLLQEKAAGYQTGRENFLAATKGEAEATQVFSTANQAAGNVGTAEEQNLAAQQAAKPTGSWLKFGMGIAGDALSAFAPGIAQALPFGPAVSSGIEQGLQNVGQTLGGPQQ
jgi:hypothetical protein